MNGRFKFAVVASSTCLVVLLLFGAVRGRGAPAGDQPYTQLGVYTDVLSHIKTDYVEEPDMKSVLLGSRACTGSRGEKTNDRPDRESHARFENSALDLQKGARPQKSESFRGISMRLAPTTGNLERSDKARSCPAVDQAFARSKETSASGPVQRCNYPANANRHAPSRGFCAGYG